MNFNAFLPLKGLTTIASVCFICKSETHSDSQSPRPTRRQAALHHRNPPRLLAPSPHPPSHRLCRLRPRPRPLSLGFDRQLSRRTHQADQASPPKQKTMVQQWLRNYRKLKATLERICELNQQLLRPEKKA